MTTQSRIRLDDLTSDALDQLYDRLDRANAALRHMLGQHQKCGIDRIAELEAEVARLTAEAQQPPTA